MLIICALTLIILLFVANYKWKRRRLEKMMRSFDGPPMVPILGNGLDFLGDPAGVLRKAETIVWNKYPSPSRVWLLNKPYVLIYSPEDFQTVANSALEKDDNYRFFVDMLGDGLFTLRGQRWKTRRKLLNSAFNPVFLKEFLLDIFNNQNRILRDKLTTKVGSGKHFDLWPYFIESSIDTIGKTALGCNGDDSKEAEDRSKFGEALMKSAKLVVQRFYRPWLFPSLIFTLYKKLNGYENVFRIVHDYPLQLLEARRKRIHKERKNDEGNLHAPTAIENYYLHDEFNVGYYYCVLEPKNFLDILLQSYEHHKLTDHEIKNEVISVFFGGSETNAVTACFLLLMLAMRQDIQEEAYKEQYEIFGDTDRNVDLADVAKMTFLESLIKETLRRFTVVPVIIRYTSEDIPISNNHVIPAGSNVILCIHAIHHDPKIYPDPLIWNPNNFTPEQEASRHKCSFVPFSFGPRSCTGIKYAMVALKIQISILLRAFKFFTNVKMEDIEFDQDMIIRSKKGYYVSLEHRR